LKPEPGLSLNPARARHIFLKPNLGLKAKFTEGLRYAHVRGKNNVVFGYSCKYTEYHTKNNSHLDQNIGMIWYKRSMLVNDNTAEYNDSQEKKKLSRNYPPWRHTYEKPACKLLKTSQESRE